MKLRNWVILAASIGLTSLGLAKALWATPPARLSVPLAQLSPTPQTSDEVVNAQLVTANTRLSFKLFSEILKQQPNQNIFISPAGVAIALDMLYNGASGQTQEAIAKTLELQGMSLQEINQANAALNASLENSDPNVQLSLANSLWTASTKPFNPEFLQQVQEYYKAEVNNLNFGTSTASSTINDWVRQSTNQKIDEIVDQQEIRPNTVFLLLNAIYFLGTWTYPFPKSATTEHTFTLLDGTEKQHPMMFQHLFGVRYYENELFQAVELPYGEGRLSMYIFLPHQQISLKTFYESLNAENWMEWMNQFEMGYQGDASQGLSIGLPRFKLEYSIELNDYLKALGMEVAFTQGADFSAMTASSVSIDKVKQKTFVEVNEEGTEAAAVTTPGNVRGELTKLTVDRPFFCAIRDNQTETILFMGSIVEPQ